ncbi:SIR2 family protein [Candidatus Sumerlaeota bacterium]|nr:SIR2 family protein [Candidatus Sumerlaeota bacterium]
MKNSSTVRPAIPHSLREAIRHQSLVLFVGSGISRSARGPTWKELLEGLLERLKEECVDVEHESQVRDLLNSDTSGLLWAAEYLQDKGSEFVQPYMQDICDRLMPKTVHDIIAKLPCRGIVTTNYDSLIEDALMRERGHVKVVLPDNRETLATLDDRSPWVLKLHGTYETRRGQTLSIGDYERLLCDSAVTATISRLFQQYTFLFLGFGMRDPDTLHQLARLNILFQGAHRMHFALVENQSVNQVQEHVLRKVYGVFTLRYMASGEHHPEIASFLRELSEGATSEPSWRIAKIVFLVPNYLSGERAEPSLLVVDHYPQCLEALLSRDSALLFPSITDTGESQDGLFERGYQYLRAHRIPLEREGVRLVLDPAPFRSKKLSEHYGCAVDHVFRFAFVNLPSEFLSGVEKSLEIGGQGYRWCRFSDLLAHEPTVQQNGDVLDEIRKRYAEELGASAI